MGRLPDGTRVAFFAPQRPYGVSSGSGEEDLEVARAGVAAIPGSRTDW